MNESNTSKSRPTLSLAKDEATLQDLLLLQEKNLHLTIAFDKLCEAVTNHKLNSKCATSADVILWDTVDSLVIYK